MKQLVEIFQIAYKDVVLAADQKLMHSARIDRWLRARYSEDEDEASSTMDGKSKAKPSEAESNDLAEQGFAKPRQMRILELSLYLGRPVGDAELEGGSYKSPAATFKVSTLASSSKFSLRAYLPWPDLPVTHTGFWDPPPFRLLY
jgi:hypothetical protein